MYATDGPFCPVASFDKYLRHLKPTEWILVSTSKEEYDGGFWCLIRQHGDRRKIPGRHDEKHIQTDRFIKAVHKPFDTGTAVTLFRTRNLMASYKT
jgi:hypothetical protein